MRIRQITLIITLLYFGIIKGQNPNSNNSSPTLPNITPPSPESFAITKYGDLPINEFSGMAGVIVPIHTFKAGNLEVPISINYSGAGVKVNDYPTKTGVSWVLKSGGIITRIVKDLPDELAGIGYRIFHTPEEYVNLNTQDGTIGATKLADYVTWQDNWDTEADIFTYDFNGYSGSFYLDQNFNPVLIKEESSLKIVRTGDLLLDKTFKITTPDGNQYFFGGNNAVETTISAHSAVFEANTGYYLTQIISPINGSIAFDYLTKSQVVMPIGLNESVTILTGHNYPGFNNPFIDASANPIFCNPPGLIDTWRMSSQVVKSNNVRYIQKIYSPDTTEFVQFNYQAINGFNVLNTIEVKTSVSNNATLIKDATLEYFGLTNFATNINNKKFFLKNVIINNSLSQNNNLSNKNEKWSFEYDDWEHLPDRNSFAQDEMGYYNGQANSTLLSSQKIKISYDQVNPLYNFHGGNRTTNCDYAKKGTLIKVTYPTRGYTTFDYECIPYKKPIRTDYLARTSIGNLTDTDQQSNPQIPYSFIPGNNGLSEDPVLFNPIIENQNVKFTFKSNRSLVNHAGGTCRLKITNVTDSLIVYNQIYGYGFYSSTIPPFNGDVSFNLTLYKDKQYKFEIEHLTPLSTSYLLNDCSYGAFLKFNIITSYEYGDDIGLRIKRQVDYAREDVISNYKRYYYVPHNYIYAPVQLQPIRENLSKFIKNRKSMTYLTNGCNAPFISFIAYTAIYETILSQPVSNMFETYNNLNECVVTSFGGENFENGGVERFYHIEKDTTIGEQVLDQQSLINSYNENFSNEIASNDFLDKTSNLNLLNGDLIKEYYFKKSGGNFYKQKVIEYNFNREYKDGYTNFVGKKFYDPAVYPPGFTIGTSTSNFYLKMYRTYELRNILNSKQETNYFDPITMPDVVIEGLDLQIIEPSDIGIKKITTTQEFTYGTLRGLPIETSTTSSDDNVLLKTKNYYPNQANTLTGISSTAVIASNTLVHQNRIASPIQVESYRGNDLLSTQRTLYKSISGTNFVLPDIIQTSKGSNALEDKVLFSEYDAKGNPTIVSLKDGSKTKYFYNSNNQVIIKVENYSAALNIPASPNLSDPCTFIAQYPQAIISVYNYNTTTNQIASIVNSNCKFMYYEYDALYRLKLIRDNENNIIQEFDQNYKLQN